MSCRIVSVFITALLISSCLNDDDAKIESNLDKISKNLQGYLLKESINIPPTCILIIEANIVCKGCVQKRSDELSLLLKNDQLNNEVIIISESDQRLAWAKKHKCKAYKKSLMELERFYPYYSNWNLYRFSNGQLRAHYELGANNQDIPLMQLING